MLYAFVIDMVYMVLIVHIHATLNDGQDIKRSAIFFVASYYSSHHGATQSTAQLSCWQANP